MIPISIARLGRRGLGQPKEATQGMIDYWREQYRDYSKDLNALWDRLRPGFTELPPRSASTPPTPPTTAPVAEIARHIGDVDKELLDEKGVRDRLFEDYLKEEAKREAERAAGWPGYPEWKRRELEDTFEETKAKLWAKLMERLWVIDGRLYLLLLEKETRLRQIRAQELKEAEAARAARQRASQDPSAVSAPPFWEDLCLLVRNLEAAEKERKARAARNAPPAAIRAAEQEVAKAVKELREGMQGRFSSMEELGYFSGWCDEVRGVHFNWRLFIRMSSVVTPPTSPTSTPTATAIPPTAPYYAQ